MNLLTKIKKSKEIKVGFLFIVAIAVMIWGLMYLKGLEIWKPKRTFYAYYERVNGLVAANPVTIKGLKVGQVRSLKFSKNKPGKIIVELVVENEYPIPKNSVARIFAGTDLLGSKEVEIELGDSKAFLESGDTIVLYTDGITEAENDKGEIIGKEDDKFCSWVKTYYDLKTGERCLRHYLYQGEGSWLFPNRRDKIF